MGSEKVLEFVVVDLEWLQGSKEFAVLEVPGYYFERKQVARWVPDRLLV